MPDWYEHIAGVNGAVLGWVHNGVPGARHGYKFGRALYRKTRMAPTGRRHSFHGYPSPKYTPGARKRTHTKYYVKRQRLGPAPGLDSLLNNNRMALGYSGTHLHSYHPRHGHAHHANNHTNHYHTAHHGGTNTSDIHSGTMTTSLRIKSHRKLPKSVRGALITLNDQRSLITNESAGGQKCQSIAVWGSANQWLNVTLASNDISLSPIRYFDLNPNDFSTGSTVIPPSTSTPLTDRLCLVAQESIVDVTNLANTAVNLEMYIFECARPTGSLPELVWDAQLTADQGTVTSVGTAPAFGTNVTGNPGGIRNGFCYQQPKGPMFRSFWHLKAKRNCFIAGGASEQVKIHITHNWVAKKELIFADFNNGLAYTKGTTVLMFRHLGMPTHDLGGAEAVHSSSRIGSIVTTRLFFKPVYGNAARIRSTLGYAGEPFGVPITQQGTISAIDVVQDTIIV